MSARLVEQSVLPFVRVQALDGRDLMAALAECKSCGVRGGAVYDWPHLAAARKAGVDAVVTLDLRDLQGLTRPGDPQVALPKRAVFLRAAVGRRPAARAGRSQPGGPPSRARR